MKEQCIFAGFGGQGMLLIGKFLAEAGMETGKHVSWLPSYGPEMRGGTANCSVVVSDKPVASPLISMADTVLAMNLPSMLKFQSEVKPGGLLLVNSSLVKEQEAPGGNFRRLDVPMYDVCYELQNTKVISSVVLGVLAALLTDVFPDSGLLLSQMLEKLKNKASLVELNRSAFEKGFALVRPGGNE